MVWPKLFELPCAFFIAIYAKLTSQDRRFRVSLFLTCVLTNISFQFFHSSITSCLTSVLHRIPHMDECSGKRSRAEYRSYFMQLSSKDDMCAVGETHTSVEPSILSWLPPLCALRSVSVSKQHTEPKLTISPRGMTPSRSIPPQLMIPVLFVTGSRSLSSAQLSSARLGSDGRSQSDTSPPEAGRDGR